MNKNNTIQVLKGVRIYTRDNAKAGTWHYYFRLNKKPYRGTTGHTDIDEAKWEAVAKYKAAKADPSGFKVKPPSFQQVAERWLKLHETDTDHTRKEMVVRRFLLPYFVEMLNLKDIRMLQQSHITDYITWRRDYHITGPGANAPATITYMRAGKPVKAKAVTHGVPKNTTLNRDNGVLRQIISFAMDEGQIPATARLKVPMLKDDGERRPDFTPEQIQTILRTAEERIGEAPEGRRQRERRQLLGYVRLLRWTGMRPAEAHSLTWRDIDLTHRQIYLRRGKTDQRAIPMLFPELITSLTEMRNARRVEVKTDGGEELNETEAIFAHRNGSPVRSFSTSFGNLLDECAFDKPEGDEDFSSYSFRHSLVTELGNMGMPDALLTKVFGTSREMIGAHYDHSSAQEALDWMGRRKALTTAPVAVPASGEPLGLTTTAPAIPLVLKGGALLPAE
ncbi:MAG TPA: tyrosine-type recombinase/integrase [Magnetospirillum sp.]|nr:tyrosine-type recombinase/integrase [Magnetospirillum sp.]